MTQRWRPHAAHPTGAPEVPPVAAAVSGPASTARTVIPPKSVAVLPFVDMSEKHDEEYFADGLAEEMIEPLSRIPALHVPA